MQVTIATVGETVFDGAARSLVAPGIDGELTVLPGHMPLITPLSRGTLRLVREDGAREEYEVVSSGILEVGKQGAVVLL